MLVNILLYYYIYTLKLLFWDNTDNLSNISDSFSKVIKVNFVKFCIFEIISLRRNIWVHRARLICSLFLIRNVCAKQKDRAIIYIYIYIYAHAPLLVLCVCFVDRCLSFWTFSFGHCVVCSSSIYGIWLPLWYLQTRLNTNNIYNSIIIGILSTIMRSILIFVYGTSN